MYYFVEYNAAIFPKLSVSNLTIWLPPTSAVKVIESERERECVCECVWALSLPNHLTYDLDFWYESWQYDLLTSQNGFLGKRTMKCPTLEVCERSGVFMKIMYLDN